MIHQQPRSEATQLGPFVRYPQLDAREVRGQLFEIRAAALPKFPH